MARKRTEQAIKGATEGLFELTQPAQAQDQEDKKTKSGESSSETISARVKREEGEMLRRIAEENDISLSLLIRYVLNWWANAYEAGRITIEFEQTPQPKID